MLPPHAHFYMLHVSMQESCLLQQPRRKNRIAILRADGGIHDLMYCWAKAQLTLFLTYFGTFNKTFRVRDGNIDKYVGPDFD